MWMIANIEELRGFKEMRETIANRCQECHKEGLELERDHIFVVAKFMLMSDELLERKHILETEAAELLMDRRIFERFFDLFKNDQSLNEAPAGQLKLAAENLGKLSCYCKRLGDIIARINTLLDSLGSAIGRLNDLLKNADITRQDEDRVAERYFEWTKQIVEGLKPPVKEFVISKTAISLEFAVLQMKWKLDVVEACRWRDELERSRFSLPAAGME